MSGSVLDAHAHGVFPIAPTPFSRDGRIDWPSVDRLADFYTAIGANGVTVLGQLGEAPKLDTEESLDIVQRMCARLKIPVIVGVTAPGFASMRALARGSLERGAAAVMIAPPRTLRTDDQIVNYYRDASAAIGEDIAFVIQDYPLAFEVQMAPRVIQRIVGENPACVMLKHEDWPGLDKISALRRFEREGSMRPLSILCGNGGLFLDCELERGADGANTGYAFPDMLIDLVRLVKAGARDQAHDLFDAHLPLLRYEQQPGVGLAVRKYVLMRRGILTSDTQRSPASSMTSASIAETEYLLTRLSRLDKRAAL